MKKKRWFFNNWSIRVKYMAAFLGTMTISYLGIFFFVVSAAAKNEQQNFQKFMDATLAQSSEFIRYEMGMMLYASETMYENPNVQLALSNCFREQEDYNPGQEYRDWLTLSQELASLQTGNIYNVCIYTPDSYIYRYSTENLEPMSTAESYEEFAVLRTVGEQAVWTMPYRLENRKTGTYVSVISLVRRVVRQEDYFQTLCIEAVSIRTETLLDILRQADTTRNGSICLLNQENIPILSSKEEIDYELWNTISQDNGLSSRWKRNLKGPFKCTIKCIDIADTGWKLAAMIPLEEVNESAFKIGLSAIVKIIPIILISLCISYMFASQFSERIKRLSFEMMHWRDRSHKREPVDMPDDEIGELNNHYNEMLKEIDALLEEKYRTGVAIKDAELKALQAQINPHFLYNTLDLINWEAMERDAVEIGELVQMLARYYRAVLNKGFDEVTLAHEIELIRTYVSIQNFRFDGRIHLQINVPEALQNKKIQKLTLQPIVENSILHGAMAADEIEEETITVDACEDGNFLLIRVADNGQGMTEEQLAHILEINPSEKSTHYAISNVHERLRLKYGSDCGLSYESILGEGTVVTVKILKGE